MFPNLLIQKRDIVLEKWIDLIIHTYPSDSAAFLKKDDQFRNPVGYTLSREAANLYDALLQEASCDKFSPSLDNIMKIRAVQDFTSYQAVAFVFFLKKAIVDTFSSELGEGSLLREFLDFEGRIDELAVCAFDSYMRCREKIHEIRLREVKKRLTGFWEGGCMQEKQAEDLDNSQSEGRNG